MKKARLNIWLVVLLLVGRWNHSRSFRQGQWEFSGSFTTTFQSLQNLLAQNLQLSQPYVCSIVGSCVCGIVWFLHFVIVLACTVQV